MEEENKGEREGENAGTGDQKLLKKAGKDLVGIDAKTEKRGGGEVRTGQEKPVIKWEEDDLTNEERGAGTSPEKPETKPGNADAVVRFRLRRNLKKNLQEEAKGRGITLTELILSRVKGSKVRDRKNEEKIITVIEDFTREFNKIGNNINQIAVAIHQIKNEHRIEGGQFAEIAKALEAYNNRIDYLRSSIHKIESDDI